MRFTLKNLRFLQYIDYQNVRKTEFLGCQSQGHAERAFSLLLARGALANHMKFTAGGRWAFSAGSPQQDRVPDSS